MDIQHFRVKLFATPESHPELAPAIAVFHRWIQQSRVPETMIDVSDYEHVPNGPGVILVCHEAIYGLDQEKGRLGLLYNRRAALNGSVEDRLRQAVDAAEAAAALLEQEPEFAGKLRFDRKAWEVAVTDRALAPNTEATWNRLSPVIEKVFDSVIGPGRYRLERGGDPRELFRAHVLSFEQMSRIQRVLLSVTDKTGIVDFASGLRGVGAELISTGGTARLIRDSGVAVRDVSEVTGFPEMLDGRVKTLHPAISGGILAIRGRGEHMRAIAEQGIQPIDMVVVNLYRFEEAAAKADAPLEELIENIDIGGPTMIRAAAKNYQDVAVVVSPADYASILEELRANGCTLSLETKWRLAKKAFRTTADYDAAITARLEQVDSREPLPADLSVRAPKIMDLRYGENPHQSAGLYGKRGNGIAGAEQLQGKELSYNNLVDLDAAWQLACEFSHPAAVIIKHTNPCGCAEQESLALAYEQAFECDPISAFGGVLGFNRPVDEPTARHIAQTFIEAIAAPAYSPEALAVLSSKKQLRLLRVAGGLDPLVLKSISGGFLVQTADRGQMDRRAAVVKSQRQPTEEEWKAMEFGWKVAKHVKSNAIVYARPGQTVGVGAGQTSRVDSVKIGAMKAVLPLEGSVVASDAFFPFPDGVEEAAKHGATAFIQPGGSVRDNEVIAAADRLGVAMVFTGIRHFRH